MPWMGYCIEHLSDQTIELARNELVNTIIPKASLIRETATTEEQADEEEGTPAEGSQQASLIRDYLLEEVYLEFPISLTTMWRWLKQIGFTYDARKKTFFVDGHERPNVVFRRNQFCNQSLSELEPRAHRWIQVTRETVKSWQDEEKIKKEDCNRGYSYQLNNEDMVEFHVDDFDFLHELAEKMGFGSIGGNLSVRIQGGTTPIMILGQDESVFSQFLLGSRQWVACQGQRALLPKSDGMGLMVSAFQSRETGFGVVISQLQMDEINEHDAARDMMSLMLQWQVMAKQVRKT